MTTYDPFDDGRKVTALMNLAQSVASPLTTLATDLAVVADSLEQPNNAVHGASSIRAHAKRIKALAKTLAEFAGQHPCKPEPVDCAMALSDLLPLLVKLAGDNVALKVEVAADIEPIVVDLFLLEQVLFTLLVRTREAMSRMSSVLIVARRNSHLNSSLDQPAPGVIVDIIFSPASSLDATLAELFEPIMVSRQYGFRLGLASVLGLVKSMNVRLSVETHDHDLTFQLVVPTVPS